MRACPISVRVACGLMLCLAGSTRPALADGSNGDLVQQINAIETGTLSVLMIFGTGLVASLCWGIGWIIACVPGSGDSDAVRSELNALRDRVARIEQGLAAMPADREPVHS